MTVISPETYLKDPCGTLSIPFWKAQRMPTPAHIRIVHEQAFSPVCLEEYRDEPYFRLRHDLQDIPQVHLPDFEITTARAEDMERICSVINRSYTDLQVSIGQLAGYTETPVYAQDLWLLVWEKATGQCVGCGIADLDRGMGELILEWIQVLPEYRRQGIGRMMVCELLRRGREGADFATVSGKCSAAAPEALYRACGFTGTDVWHILQKR